MIFTPEQLQAILTVIMENLFASLGGQILPLVNMIGTTPLEFTVQHPVVIAAWRTFTLVADVLLGLFIVIGTIQIMFGDTTGTLRLPVGEFVARAILTAILIHLSAFIGETLLNFNNLLCDQVNANLEDFIRGVNNGQNFNTIQILLLGLVMAVVFGIGLFRMIFQAIMRIIRFNVLFVLSGLAFLCSFHPMTAPIFSIWIRIYILTIFEQFLQFLTFGLGIQFLIATQLTGLPGFILAVAMINLTAEIPKLLERFGVAAGGGGFGSLGTTVIKTASLLA